jgi:membrane protease YdiL (CAAX protease family)
MEELVFRGLLLRWLGRQEWGGHVAMFLAFLAAVGWQPDTWRVLLEGSPWQTWILVLAPPLFVLLMVPGYVYVCRRQRTSFPAALYGTSLLFGIMHGFAWPSPVSLFVLALGLGWLMHRTQSLVGPIVLHSLFNGVACVQLLQLF